MARQLRAEGHPTPQHLTMDAEEAMQQLTGNRGRSIRLTTWAVLDSWRTITAEQLAAFTESQLVLDPAYSQLSASFALDLIDIGQFSHPANRRNTANQIVYRPAGSDRTWLTSCPSVGPSTGPLATGP